MTARELRREAAVALRDGVNVATAELDASVLLSHVLGLDRAQALARDREDVSDAAATEFRRLVQLRCTGYPVAYMVGHKEFFGRQFIVDERVLIPRPDTEVLVETALKYLLTRARDRRARVLDVGTGSGCVIISIALECAAAGIDVECCAVDISPASLSVARRNAELLGAPEITWLESDLFSALGETRRKFDLIASNPPYVERAHARRSAEAWKEPVGALDGGETGMEFPLRLFSEARHFLADSSPIMVEIGAGQSEALALSLPSLGYSSYNLVLDLAGIPRCLVAHS